MLVDIQINEKTLETMGTFKLSDIATDRNHTEVLAIVTILSADYYLDPEIEVADLKSYMATAMEQNKEKLTFTVSEEGLELEFE